ncbi:MAG: endolytic transglycosylase MltG [Pseudomonadota bacterium]
MRSLAATVLTLLILIGIGAALALGWAQREVDRPGPLAEEVLIEVPRGAGVGRTSDILAQAGAIRHDWLFRINARYTGQARQLKFGEYRLPAGASIAELTALLVAGANVQHRVTIAEGLTSWEAVEMVRAADVLTGEIAEVPPEGTLAPDTYFVTRGESRQTVLDRMSEAQRARVAEIWENADRDALPITSAEELVILASIVEKETGVAAERPQVASVFVNRLRRGMRLQSDPTVVYGVTEGKGPLGRGLRRSELDRRTPWNTYQIDRLPVTAIANPGLAALQAVVNPAVTNYLYFVADGTGGHAFAETLDAHNRNVRRWRAIERERQ